MPEAIRWTIKVSRDTDLSLRSFLGAQGMKKGDLSKFVEEAVRWRVLERTVQRFKDRNQDVGSGRMEAIINEAVRAVRAEMQAELQAKPKRTRRG
ncbi:MAG: hypothetical protein A3F74_10125 [Betaproteobacteria bacterium RIFCSPLOWO2_12_FULL_62_58]|nr:MAG: hypothetical protein A3F74_10125 [Betaproteobacteria bacterium RIFCSPLOWO2_12_FULL_62_58]